MICIREGESGSVILYRRARCAVVFAMLTNTAILLHQRQRLVQRDEHGELN